MSISNNHLIDVALSQWAIIKPIFQHLDYRSRARLGMVCRSFSHTYKEHFAEYYHLYLIEELRKEREQRRGWRRWRYGNLMKSEEDEEWDW